MTKATIQSVCITNLPAIGRKLADGVFAGIITRQNGDHCAVVLLPGHGKDLTWTQARGWALKQGGELPSRPVIAMLFANARTRIRSDWHWTNEEYNADSAWVAIASTGTKAGATRNPKPRLLPSATSRLIDANALGA